MFYEPDHAANRITRPRPARLGGAMFGTATRKTPFHAGKLRGDESARAHRRSGFETSVHGASSGGAGRAPTLACPGGALLMNQTTPLTLTCHES